LVVGAVSLFGALASPVPTVWQRNLETAGNLIPTRDGGVLVLGGTNISTFDSDPMVVKLNGAGAVVWRRQFGGANADALPFAAELADGSFVLMGPSWSGASKDKKSTNYGDDDFWIVRLSASGDLIWETSWGGIGREFAVALIVRGDAIFVAGQSDSPASGNKSAPRSGQTDLCLVKLDLAGRILWDKSFGGEGGEALREMLADDQGRIFLAGHSSWPPGRTPSGQSVPAKNYCWVVCVDGDGKQIWEGSYSDTGFELTGGAAMLPDGALAVGGDWLLEDQRAAFVVKIDAATGQSKWRRLLEAEREFGAIAAGVAPGSVIIANHLERDRIGNRDWSDYTYFVSEIDADGACGRERVAPPTGEAQSFVTELRHVPGRGVLFARSVQRRFEGSGGYGAGGDVLFWWLDENFEPVGTNYLGGDRPEIFGGLVYTSSGEIVGWARSESNWSQNKTTPYRRENFPNHDWFFKLPGWHAPNAAATEVFIEPYAVKEVEEGTPLVARAETAGTWRLEFTEDFVTWELVEALEIGSMEPVHALDPVKGAWRFYRLRRE
jgi:hypothetical protein